MSAGAIADRARMGQLASMPAKSAIMPGIMAPVDVPPSSVAAASHVSDEKFASANGTWRVQLGAFSNAANADKLWQKVAKNVTELVDLKPILKTGGALTRLQASPFSSKAEAQAICTKLKEIGQQCLGPAQFLGPRPYLMAQSFDVPTKRVPRGSIVCFNHKIMRS